MTGKHRIANSRVHGNPLHMSFLNKLLGNKSKAELSPPPFENSEKAKKAVNQYWNNWQTQRNEANMKWNDWGAHPHILSCIYNQLFGSPDFTVFDFLKEKKPEFATANVLSLCSGDGGFERSLIENGVFGKVTGIELAEERVNTAKVRHQDLAGQLDFMIGDVNAGFPGEDSYDAVFAKAALHHVENLETLFNGMHSALNPGGRLITIDYFGPARLQWSDEQLYHANRILTDLIPARFRMTDKGVIKNAILRPDIEEMIETDPSEAVRSDEIYKFITEYFSIEEEFEVGGALLNLVFTADIINNFPLDDHEGKTVIEKAFHYERSLMEKGIISPDFKFIIGKIKHRQT